MNIFTLSDFLFNIDISARLYFQTRIDDRDSIIHSFDTTLRGQLLQFLTGTTVQLNYSPIYAITDNNFVYLARNKGLWGLVCDYEVPHLGFSLITHYLFNNAYPIKERVDAMVFTWYHVLFMKSPLKINDLTHNVCFQIEEAIKIILAKELTTYREFNTADVIAALRNRLASERFVNMGGQSTGVNLRKL